MPWVPLPDVEPQVWLWNHALTCYAWGESLRSCVHLTNWLTSLSLALFFFVASSGLFKAAASSGVGSGVGHAFLQSLRVSGKNVDAVVLFACASMNAASRPLSQSSCSVVVHFRRVIVVKGCCSAASNVWYVLERRLYLTESAIQHGKLVVVPWFDF